MYSICAQLRLISLLPRTIRSARISVPAARRWCSTTVKPLSPSEANRHAGASTTGLSEAPAVAAASPHIKTKEHAVSPEFLAEDPAVLMSTPEGVRQTFCCSVQARTISNAQLRRYILQLLPKDYALAQAAAEGARAGGLRVNALTYEALMAKLLAGGQLKASMELYQYMLREHMTPTAATYSALMKLCLAREMPSACQQLFMDLQKRGLQPSAENYELMITALAAEHPPKWQLAIQVFDKLSRERHSRITAATYNALMRVYLGMRPFDWRVVYNCYYEMRSRKPAIPLKWESYLLLREALQRGQAGWVRRSMAYMDAWIAVTSLRSWDFAMGVAVYFAVMLALKSVVGYIFVWYCEHIKSSTSGAAGESILPA